MRVGDDGVTAIHGAVIQIKEPLWLAIPDHIAGVAIGAAYFNFLRLRLRIGGLQRLLTVCCAVFRDGPIQRLKILRSLDPHFNHIELVLVGVGLQMR